MYDCQQLQLMYQIHQVKDDNQIIDIHPRAISQNISKIWWQFFMHLSMVNELISKPCTSWVSVSSPMFAKSHVTMHDWTAEAANSPSQLTQPAH